MNTSTRINLTIPLELAISIEKECDKRGIKPPQYIKEAVFEKIKRVHENDDALQLNQIHDDIRAIKEVIMQKNRI